MRNLRFSPSSFWLVLLLISAGVLAIALKNVTQNRLGVAWSVPYSSSNMYSWPILSRTSLVTSFSDRHFRVPYLALLSRPSLRLLLERGRLLLGERHYQSDQSRVLCISYFECWPLWLLARTPTISTLIGSGDLGFSYTDSSRFSNLIYRFIHTRREFFSTKQY